MALRPEVITTPEALARIEPAWRELTGRTTTVGARTFVSPDWVLPWLATHGRDAQLRAVALWDGSRLEALFLLQEAPKRFGRWVSLRAWQGLWNDYAPEGGWLVAPGRAAEAATALGSLLADPDRGPGVLHLSPVARHHAQAAPWAETPAPGVLNPAGEDHVIDVTGDWESFASSKSRNFRNECRQARSRAAKLAIQISRIETVEDWGHVQPELERVSGVSWQGKAGTGTFSDAWNCKFYGEVCLKAARSGRLWLHVARIPSGRVAGYLLSLKDGERVDALKTEFDPEFEHAKIGYPLHTSLYRDCHAAGIRFIHLGNHPTEFKLRWISRTEPQATLLAAGPTWKGRALMAAAALRH
jgi:hypothetical protein